jgi:hypothetical protein
MSLGFRASTDKDLRPTDNTMGVGQVSIQRQRPLAFPNALSRAFR